MLNQVARILVFLIVSAIGSFMAALIFNLAVLLHLFPHPAGDQLQHGLGVMVFSVSPWIWLAAMAVSLGSFFTKGEARLWLLLAPLYGPALYSLLVLIYFNVAAAH